MNLTLHVWRQKTAKSEGHMAQYDAPDISEDMSFLEMLDVVNERLIEHGDDPIAFDHDCREGICGTCGLRVGGVASHSRHPSQIVIDSSVPHLYYSLDLRELSWLG